MRFLSEKNIFGRDPNANFSRKENLASFPNHQFIRVWSITLNRLFSFPDYATQNNILNKYIWIPTVKSKYVS